MAAVMAKKRIPAKLKRTLEAKECPAKYDGPSKATAIPDIKALDNKILKIKQKSIDNLPFLINAADP